MSSDLFDNHDPANINYSVLLNKFIIIDLSDIVIEFLGECSHSASNRRLLSFAIIDNNLEKTYLYNDKIMCGRCIIHKFLKSPKTYSYMFDCVHLCSICINCKCPSITVNKQNVTDCERKFHNIEVSDKLNDDDETTLYVNPKKINFIKFSHCSPISSGFGSCCFDYTPYKSGININFDCVHLNLHNIETD